MTPASDCWGFDRLIMFWAALHHELFGRNEFNVQKLAEAESRALRTVVSHSKR
jgi:hypothetical protein